jgi:hypothetical protein
MGSVTHPRGRLPRRVYWTRRAVILVVALLLVFGIGKMLGGNGQDPAGTAVQASTSSAQQPAPTQGPVAPSQVPRQKAKVPLLAPNGVCRDDEVSVVPSVPRAWGASPITIHLALQGLQPACTFKVSPKSLVVMVSSGTDRVWSSQDCPVAIPTSDVVVRSGVATDLDVTWNGRRSDTGCPKLAYALKGFYHVYAAALGSTPTDVQFEITRAPLRVVRKTAKPKPSETASPTSHPSVHPSGHPTKGSVQPSGSPSPTNKP